MLQSECKGNEATGLRGGAVCTASNQWERCAVRRHNASLAVEQRCPDSAGSTSPVPARRAATTSRTRRMMKRRRTPGWPRGKEVRPPEHKLKVWHPEVCPAGAQIRGFGLTEMCFALDPATFSGQACFRSSGSAVLCPNYLACPQTLQAKSSATWCASGWKNSAARWQQLKKRPR